MWVFTLLAMAGFAVAIALAAGVVGWLLQVLWVKLGNPGGVVTWDRPRRQPGKGYYVEPGSDGGP